MELFPLPQPQHAASACRSSEPSVKAPRRSRTCPVRPRSETEPGRRVVAKGDWFSALRMGWSAPNRQVPLPHTPIAALDREQSRGVLRVPNPTSKCSVRVRSAERRVGKESVRSCQSRWSRIYYKKKIKVKKHS